MGHVIEHIAQETPCKDDACHGLRQDEPQEHIEEGNHQRGWHWGEDQAGAIKGCLWAERCGYQRQPATGGDLWSQYVKVQMLLTGCSSPVFQ